ncbi:hypothetical protein V8C42DRAFT_329613 [Trichoderma barbatum]
MSFSRNRRLRRLVIEPIQTSNATTSNISGRFLRRRLGPLSGITSTEINSLGLVGSRYGSTKREMRPSLERQALKKLDIPEATSGVIEFTNLGSGPVYHGAYIRRAIIVKSPSSAGGHHMPKGRGHTSLPHSPNTLRMSLSITLSTSYTPKSPSDESELRRKQLADIQRSRLGLWEQGSKRFGRLEDADVFVRPLPLRRCLNGNRSPSEDPYTPSPASTPSSLSSPTLIPPTPTSPTSASSRRLSVRAIIHSKSNTPVGLKREFDLDALRATIPDPLPSPRSPNFDREALLSNLRPLNRKRRASSPADSDSLDARDNKDDNEGEEADGSYGNVEEIAETATSPQPSKRRRVSSQHIAVPINAQYARAQLPALAAIIMSDRVRRGDTIELALPHPGMWPETVAYVYTGEAQLLTEQTKENILHLGGKI